MYRIGGVSRTGELGCEEEEGGEEEGSGEEKGGGEDGGTCGGGGDGLGGGGAAAIAVAEGGESSMREVILFHRWQTFKQNSRQQTIYFNNRSQ